MFGIENNTKEPKLNFFAKVLSMLYHSPFHTLTDEIRQPKGHALRDTREYTIENFPELYFIIKYLHKVPFIRVTEIRNK